MLDWRLVKRGSLIIMRAYNLKNIINKILESDSVSKSSMTRVFLSILFI